MNKIDLSKINLRTDLIIEKNNINHEEKEIDGIKITSSYQDGNYITLSFEDITDFDYREKVGKHFEKIFKDILKLNNIKESDTCLIIGLGNRLSTPDSLGPKVIDDIIVTNHLFEYGSVKEGIRRVYSLIPGVMANTGIESSIIISSIIKEIKPDFVICIDALASMSLDRINKTIQITDTGIHPGSGVGNNRLEISKKTMEIPVIAIGVPTVTTATTIVYDTINYLYKHISYIKDNENINKLSFIKRNYKKKLNNLELSDTDKQNLLGLFGTLNDTDQRNLINEVLTNTELNLIVTPTEIDFLINKLSSLLSSSINNALHRQITHF
ncbi:MAG: GPR endopeptidase [Bacilli bacterium]|nr:GPR endopeptidase [Bacilli bacterium]